MTALDDAIAKADEVLALDEKATPGPWSLAWPVCVPNGQPDDIDVHYGVKGPSDGESWPIGYEEDAALIASYRNAAPDLARTIRAVAGVLDEIRSYAEFSDRMTDDGDRSRAYRQQIRFVDDIRAAIERRLKP